MKSRLLVFAVLAAACSSGPRKPAAAPAKPTPAPEAKPPADDVIDRGSFVLLIGEAPIGTEQFTISRGASGITMKSTTRIVAEPVAATIESTLQVDAGWKPVGGTFSIASPGETLTLGLERRDGVLVQTGLGDAETRENAPSDVYVMSNVIVHFSSVCALAGDAEKKLVVFPGMELSFSPRRALDPKEGVDVVTATLAGMSRIVVACEGPKLLALREPLKGFSAARPGVEPLVMMLVPERAKPVLPEGLSEEDREVKVPAEGDDPEAVLSCSLITPIVKADAKSARPPAVPGVVFFTGSGGQDRDEDSVGAVGLKLSIFKVLAIALGQAGIASLRCDDRGVGRSTGGGTKVTLHTFVRDGKAMLAALRAEPRVDAKRTGFIGHSEGAVVALSVAKDDAALRALVLMAGTGRPLDQVILEQIEEALRAAGADEDVLRKVIADRKLVHEAIAKHEPLPASVSASDRAQIEAMAPWLESHFKTDPSSLAAKVKKKLRVLVAQGDRDIQVKVRDSVLLRDALKKAGAKVTYKVYAGLNHLFAAATTGGIADYADPDANVDPTFVADVASFLKTSLAR
jgi:hypothetical protein